MGTALADEDPTDRGRAAIARLARSIIHLEIRLICPRLLSRIAIVTDGSPPTPQGMRKNEGDRGSQRRLFSTGEQIRFSGWVNFCAKKGFIGIDIPDAGDDALIQEKRLNVAPMCAK